ncbi:MAG: lycopene cyclase domain-containing protein [Nocardioidaceae bacterium]
MPEYPLMAAAAVVAVAVLELAWLRTGVFRSGRYWAAMAIVLGFQVPVDGWLTKLGDPVVLYRASSMLGVRWPWDIPVEDFAFGFAMITLAIVLWEHAGARRQPETG